MYINSIHTTSLKAQLHTLTSDDVSATSGDLSKIEEKKHCDLSANCGDVRRVATVFNTLSTAIL